MVLIKKQRAKDKVNNNDFYKKPVDKIIEEIKTNEEDRIILTGSRGCGKTTVLTSLANDSIYTESPCFFTSFESVGIFSGLKQATEERCYKHYYELVISSRLLNFIKTYYNNIFEAYFKEDFEKINNLLKELDNFIRNYLYTGAKIKKIYTSGSLIEQIIYKIKSILNLETLNLAIDRFDWIDNRKKISQEILSEYFKYFDKSIITSDDKDLTKERLDVLSQKGYKTIEVSYGKNYEIIKEILRRHALYYNSHLKENNKYFPFNEITEGTLKEITLLANGDIETILIAMQDANLMYDWSLKCKLNEQIIIETKDKLRKREEVESISQKRTLHL